MIVLLYIYCAHCVVLYISMLSSFISHYQLDSFKTKSPAILILFRQSLRFVLLDISSTIFLLGIMFSFDRQILIYFIPNKWSLRQPLSVTYDTQIVRTCYLKELNFDNCKYMTVDFQIVF